MLFLIISFILLAYSCLNYRKGFRLFIAYQIIWYPVKVGPLPLTIVMAAGLTFLYFVNNGRKERAKTKCPYLIAFLAIFVSLFITPFTAMAGFGTEFSRSITIICRSYVIAILAWESIESEKEFRDLFKLIAIVMLISGLYGLIEYVTKSNFILQYKALLSDGDIHFYELTKRGYRLTSLFEHPIGAGMTFGLYAAFVLVAIVELKEKLPLRRLSVFAAVISIPCILLTKMRASILFTLICCLTLVHFSNIKNKKFYRMLGIGILAFPVLYYVFKENSSIFLSIFDSRYQQAIGGSDATMRFAQLAEIRQIMRLSPISGLGETFKQVHTFAEVAKDYESIWFEQMAMHGMIGIVATIILVAYTTFIVPIKYRSRAAFFFALAYWVTYTLSSVPSFRIVLFYIFEFYFIKKSDVYKKMTPDKRKRLVISVNRKRKCFIKK